MDKLNEEFNCVYLLYAKAIFRFTYFKVSNYELAEDLTEETFVRFWKRLLAKEEIKNNKAFLYFIAYRLIIDYYRTKKDKGNVPIYKIDERLIIVSEDLEKKIDNEDEIKKIFGKLKLIKKDYRDIILLYYIEEMKIANIVYILNKKENAVRVNIHRALKALKEKL